ncbi:DUF4012 domain-containing protein [Candidatus Uhrbacteria bacterium]|nr:DUF4012 domain-containing protein [Candidatus Uhrbacteria bacterium]
MHPYHLPTHPKIERPLTHATSPFILSLKPTACEAHLEEARRVHVNLLMRSAPCLDKTPDLSGDLALTHAELADQFAEEILHAHGSRPFTLPLPRLHPEAVSFSWLCGTSPQSCALTSAARATLSWESFLPTAPPEDIFSFFDFPEEDGAPEADLVDLDEIETSGSPSATQTKRTWRRAFASLRMPTIRFEPSWQKAVASFVAFSFVFVLPLHAMNVVQDLRATKTELEQTGTEAATLLSDAARLAMARDGENAQAQFILSSDRFAAARETLADLGAGTRLLLAVLPFTQSSYKTGEALVRSGEELAIAGARLSEGYTAIEQEISPTPISRLNLLHAYAGSVLPHLEAAQEALAQVDPQAVPEDRAADVLTLTESVPKLIATIEAFESFYAMAGDLLGASGSKRYLIVFQNNTELRPTGGFIGSFAEIKVRDGVIEHMDVPGGGSYDLQGTLQENLMAPEPLQLLKARWEFQDGNWFPDFPTSARQLIQFYRDAGGPSVDGVLAVNATFVADLIGLLGPIDMPDYGRTITQENFIFEAQRVVELEYDRALNRPKAFIGDLAPLLMDRAAQKTSEDFLSSLDFVSEGLAQKDLQLYLTDEASQREGLARGWGGEIKQTDGDYLMVVDTNLGGGKTDGVIQETIDLTVRVQEDGTIVNTATISRTHLGIPGLLFTGVNNVDYLRVYVPKGSQLLDSEGFSPPDASLFERPPEDWDVDDDLAYAVLTQTVDPESGTVITQEHGKTVFGNWVQTRPGSTSTVTFSYQLPFTVDRLSAQRIGASFKSLMGLPQMYDYTLQVQKQSGVIDRTTRVNMETPQGTNVLWTSDDAPMNNDTDRLFAALLEIL